MKDNEDNSPLLMAATSRNHEAVNLLLKSGADPRTMNKDGDTFYCLRLSMIKVRMSNYHSSLEQIQLHKPTEQK